MTIRYSLIKDLKILVSELRNNGKNETADYFDNHASIIEKETESSRLRESLQQLCGSAAITQYANFTYHEEAIFDKCYENAKNLLEET
jgi:hypothetical protein